MRSIPAAGEEKFRCPNIFSLVSFAGMTLDKCAVLRIGTVTGAPLVQASHHLCRLKNPTVFYMITCRLSSCKTGVYNVRLLIILDRGCSSMYRKKDSISHMLNEPLLAVLKAILVTVYRGLLLCLTEFTRRGRLFHPPIRFSYTVLTFLRKTKPKYFMG